VRERPVDIEVARYMGQWSKHLRRPGVRLIKHVVYMLQRQKALSSWLRLA